MKVVFRADSGKHIGYGHIYRCLVLANELSARGHEIHFVTKNHTGFLEGALFCNYTVHIMKGGLQASLSIDSKNNYELWLGESVENDLSSFQRILSFIGEVELIIFDHYAIDYKYESNFIERKIMVIDDMTSRKHNCHFLLDQNLSADLEVYKENNFNKDCCYFIGPAFSLLRPEFKNKRATLKRKGGLSSLKNILVFFGGFDLGDNTLKLIDGVSASGKLGRFNIVLILNSKDKNYFKVKELIKFKPTISILNNVDCMAEMISSVDFCIGANGISSLERSCLGKPSVTVDVLENQYLITKSLLSKELIISLGNSKDVTVEVWRNFFEDIESRISELDKMGRKSFELVDGMGAERVADIIEEVLHV